MTLITATVKNKIQSILSVIETGKAEGDYSALVTLKDGANQSKQITYGKHQTIEQGGLKKLIAIYVQNPAAKYGKELSPYLGKIGAEPLADNESFKSLLRLAGADKVMKDTQDFFFDTNFWIPAEKFFNENAFTLPLSMLTVYDSQIHSGSVLSSLRSMFSEAVPKAGGDEKKWVQAYVTARHEWLKNNKIAILHNTIYRTQAMLDAIKQNNWLLDKPYTVNGHTVK